MIDPANTVENHGNLIDLVVDATCYWGLLRRCHLVGQEINRARTFKSAEWETERLQERIDVARRFYLEALQRELANIIMSESLETFAKAFSSMRDWQYQIEEASSERRHAEYKLLLEKYSSLEDFDIIATRHFILYNHRPIWGIDDLVERYKEISKFLILDVDGTSKPRGVFSEREVEIFRERIQMYKDLRLRNAIKEGMRRYDAFRSGSEAPYARDKSYEDAQYLVLSLSGVPGREFSPELEWGVHCKELNEYGLHTYFAGDDDKDYRSYYRSNSIFSVKDVLTD